jgi:hypothetical protein
LQETKRPINIIINIDDPVSLFKWKRGKIFRSYLDVGFPVAVTGRNRLRKAASSTIKPGATHGLKREDKSRSGIHYHRNQDNLT